MSMEFLLATGIGFVTACAIYLMLRGRTFPVVLGLSLLGPAGSDRSLIAMAQQLAQA